MIRTQLVNSFTHAALSPDPDLAVAALMIARVENPRLESGPYLEQLDALGGEAKRRVAMATVVPGDAPPHVDPDRYARVMALNDYLFGELHFVGNEAAVRGSAQQLSERSPRPAHRHSHHAGLALHGSRAAARACAWKASTSRDTSCCGVRARRGLPDAEDLIIDAFHGGALLSRDAAGN